VYVALFYFVFSIFFVVTKAENPHFASRPEIKVNLLEYTPAA